MPGTDGLSQKRASRQRKTGDPTPLQLSEALDGEPRATEDDFMLDDDGTTSPTRSHSTSIRRANLVSPPRTSASQISPIPQRRTGGQVPRPEQTTASLPTSLPTKPYPRNNITRQQALPPNILKGKVHWLLPLGIGMIAMLVLWELGSFTLAWGLARYDDIRYGNPRTYQTNAVVGHGKDSPLHPTHFIAINLNRQAIVVEFPAGNPSGAQSYVVPYYILGQGGDLTPITLEFRDVTGDSKPDMIIHIHLQTQDQTFVFVNDANKFRPPTSKDNIHL
ncbi:MAG: hypothetical protein ACJ797_28170 [Ktedonobacteraceae bacterium]